jgi:hypothetical protein
MMLVFGTDEQSVILWLVGAVGVRPLTSISC